MAGGTWSSQNKVLPGVYIRFKTGTSLGLTVGERGTATICEPMSWGPVAQVMEVAAGADMTPYTGYDITATQNRFLQEIFILPKLPFRLILLLPAAVQFFQESFILLLA